MTPNEMITRRTARPTSESDRTAMEFGQAHAELGGRDDTFRALSSEERKVLSRWLAAARAAGIDAAEDLGLRPWPAPAAEAIIGIFKAGHLLASWLIVGQRGSWAVACCADGGVSPSLGTLTDALSLVCPVGPSVMSP